MNKKGQVSRTIILFSVLIFYAVVFLLYGAYGKTVYDTQTDEILQSNSYTASMDSGTTEWKVKDTEKAGLSEMTKYVRTGFKEVNEDASWINIIVFIPASILVGYLIIASFIPTINAGG